MSVLVTDASGNHALAVTRSLGGRGIHVALADCSWGAKGFYSRFCGRRAVYPSPTRGVRAFRSTLCRILDEVRPNVLMPMTERTIMALAADRDLFESRVSSLPIPPEDVLRIAFDKHATIQLAASLGVPVPRTFAPAHLDDLRSLQSQVTYPAVIKPRRSEIHTTDDRIVPSGSVDYCFKPADLDPTYRAVHRRAPFPLIQEFIPGDGYGVSVLYRRGHIKALFAHRRLRMVRPTGSGSALRESVLPPATMVAAARRLLDELKWHGVAMVEFKVDARDGVAKLMEINGRFWNSLPLAVAAGVDFPFLLYRLATDGDVDDCFQYRIGVRGRWLVGDARHLIEVLRGRPAGWTDHFPGRWETLREFVKFFGRDLHYDVLSLSDPLPFLADVAEVLIRQVPAALSRRRLPPVTEMPDA